MPDIRPATPDDAGALARLHVACWRETYPGLLPESEIAARTVETRRAQWLDRLASGRDRVLLLPGLGFAEMGPQRDDALREAGWEEELHALYLLRAGHRRGHGRALLSAIWSGRPASALVVAGNAAACAFYASTGAQVLETRRCRIGEARVDEHVYVWPGG
ncbi:MAG: hypothetical protein WBA25_14985, partial [Jannaschia sp.]